MVAAETRLVRPKARKHPIVQLAHAALVALGRGTGAGILALVGVAGGGGGGGSGGGLDGRDVSAGGGHGGSL
jgi:hypothetical protein